MHHTGTWIIHACRHRRGSSPWQHSIHEICGAKSFLCPLSTQLPHCQQHSAPHGHIPVKSLCRCRQSTPPSRCSPWCSWWGRWRSPRRRTPSPAAKGNRNVINDTNVMQWHHQQYPNIGFASVGTPWCYTEPLEHQSQSSACNPFGVCYKMKQWKAGSLERLVALLMVGSKKQESVQCWK